MFRPWVPVVLLLTVWAGFLHVYAGDGCAFYRDILRTDLPMRVFISGALRAGRLPEWYPYDGLGLPFIGNAEGLFRPFTLLYVVMTDTLAAIKLEIVLSYLAGLGGFTLLARKLGLGVPAALVGAVAFAFCGYSVSLQSNLPYLAPLHTLPWVLWAAVHALRDERPWRWVALCAVFWALVLLGGDPLLSIFTGAALLCLAVAEGQSRRALRLAAAIPLVALLCAMWLLPAWALFKESARVGWAPDTTTLALFPARLPEMLVGGAWLDPDQEMFVKHDLDGGDEIWASSIFLGASVLGLGAFAAQRRSRPALCWLGLGVLFTWAATGAFGGLHPLLQAAFPLLKVFRYPEKYLALSVFCFALAAAYGAELAPSAGGRALARAVGLAAAGLGLLVAVLQLTVGFRPAIWGVNADAVSFLTSGWTTGAAVTFAFLVATAALLAGSRTRPQLALGVPLLLGLELFLATGHLNWLVPRTLLSTPPLFCKTALAAGGGLGRSRVFTSIQRYPPLLSARDSEAWTAATLNLLQPNAAALCGLESANSPDFSGTPSRLVTALDELDGATFGRLYGVGLRVEEVPKNFVPGPRVLAQGGRFALLRPVDPPLPRAYIGRPHWVASAADSLVAVKANPSAMATDPVLERATAESLEPEEQVASGSLTGSATVTDYAPETVLVNAELSAAGVLVLNDLGSRGWHAAVDAVETPLFRANYLVRAVRVPAGRHTVRFWYETPYLRAGLALSGLGLALALMLVLLDRRARERTSERRPRAC